MPGSVLRHREIAVVLFCSPCRFEHGYGRARSADCGKSWHSITSVTESWTMALNGRGRNSDFNTLIPTARGNPWRSVTPSDGWYKRGACRGNIAEYAI